MGFGIKMPKFNPIKTIQNTIKNPGKELQNAGRNILGMGGANIGGIQGALGAKDITDALFNKPQVPGMPSMDGTAPPDLDKVTQDANDAQRAKLGKRFSSGAGLFGGLFGGGGSASRTSASSLLGF